MKTFYLLFVAVIMTACAGPCDEPISVETESYVVTDFNPPKHVSVDLKRLSDGRTFHVSFGKHCNGYSEHLYIGRQVSINRYTYTDGETDRIEFHDEDLQNCFCD
jgi:hypothetical protein